MSHDNNVQKAMDWLADTAEGASALKAVSEAGEALRAKVPVKLSNAELKYVMEKLWAQRSVHGWDQKAHFDLHPTAAADTGATVAKLPADLNVAKRVRDLGFVIRASIPQSRFGEEALHQ